MENCFKESDAAHISKIEGLRSSPIPALAAALVSCVVVFATRQRVLLVLQDFGRQVNGMTQVGLSSPLPVALSVVAAVQLAVVVLIKCGIIHTTSTVRLWNRGVFWLSLATLVFYLACIIPPLSHLMNDLALFPAFHVYCEA